ncbi:ATG8-interacting protein 2-like protein, partial [Tanacetum coccineum]
FFGSTRYLVNDKRSSDQVPSSSHVVNLNSKASNGQQSKLICRSYSKIITATYPNYSAYRHCTNDWVKGLTINSAFVYGHVVKGRKYVIKDVLHVIKQVEDVSNYAKAVVGRDKEEGQGTTPRGADWEVVSLTASTYAAAPGGTIPKFKLEEKGDEVDKDKVDSSESENVILESKNVEVSDN